MTQIIHEGTNPDFFVSMKKYINWSGKISIPDILGFGNPDIIHDLQAKVNSIYPNIFETSVALTKPQNKMVKLTATMQKKGEKIIAKARNSLLISQDPIICQGIEIKETGLNLSSEATLALAIDYESSKKSSDALRKRFKHAKADLEYAKNLKYNQYEKKNKDSLKDWVQKTIEENKFGSTILVNTEQYLTNIFIQPCLTCHNLDLSKKKLKVNKIGYNLQITINCKMCQGITEYNNELPGTKFSLLAAGAGLVGGVNRRQLQTIFSMMGVTTQSSKGHYYDRQNEYLKSINNEAEVSAQIALTKAIAYIKAKGERILPASFDCSWSHCRNANQASGELIFQGNLEDYDHKPVIAFSTAEKPRQLKNKDGKEYEVFHGNHEQSSRQMEHAILLRIIEKISPVLEEAEVLLDICVDGDLNSNKTLNNIPCVSKVYADLKHVGKNIRAKIAKNSIWKDYENTIMTYYNSCVYAASGRKLDGNKITVSDDELEKVQIEPHLRDHTSNQIDQFREFLKKIFYIPTKQSLITHIRTSYNEAFNCVKLCFQDKKIDYWKTYSTRHALAVLQYNNGLLNMLEISRSACNIQQLSEADKYNINQISEQRIKQNQKNVISIAERNQERGKKIQEQKRNLETFDWDKDYVPYGRSVQEKIKAKEFEPTFAKYIFDFEKIIKCLACDAFPKYSPTGLCQYHDFCLKFGYHHEFPNNQYTPPSQDLKANPPTSYDVLTKVFKYQKFQESQEMAISEYVNGNHTFVSMRTGAGKSMCYWISAIMRGGLTIVISPLVSLIDDQVIAGIGCASIYTGEDRPREYFEKVFSEIAVGLTKLIYVTAESFVYNESFTKMLLNFSKNSPVSFVIDEENHHLFPDIPIMMLTGTCKEIDAHAILENLCISPSDVTFVQGISFSCPELKIEVHSKSTKEKLIREIIMLLKELEDGKCIIYCPTVHVCDNVYELLCEKADLDMIWQCITVL
ncbi:839_t:CDS:2 [Entrophospora sp. SA101]|nr:839_t:CDS:2 [Entrophospora sp. SA101]